MASQQNAKAGKCGCRNRASMKPHRAFVGAGEVAATSRRPVVMPQARCPPTRVSNPNDAEARLPIEHGPTVKSLWLPISVMMRFGSVWLLAGPGRIGHRFKELLPLLHELQPTLKGVHCCNLERPHGRTASRAETGQGC